MVLFNFADKLISFYWYLVTSDTNDVNLVFELDAVEIGTGVVGDNIRGLKINVDLALFKRFLSFFG